MRKLLVLSCLLVLTGCPKKKGETADAAAAADAESAEAGGTAAAATDADAQVTTAKNAADVARFASETKIESEAAKVAVPTSPRTAPRSGSAVAMLRAGADVTKIAEHQDCVLVTFPDPKDAATTLMGWVGKDAFHAPSDAGVSDAGPKDAGGKDAGKPGPLKCAAGQEAVSISAGEPVCKKKCAKDAECKGGKPGSCAVAATAVGGKAVRVCVSD